MDIKNKFFLVHFIENHISNINFNLNLFGKNSNFETEIISKKNFKKNNFNYTSVLYCIKIPNPSPEFEAIIQFKEENDEVNIYRKKLSSSEIKLNVKNQYI